MTEKHINQIKAQLPGGEKIERMYRAFEGDIRFITKDRAGREKRYTVRHDAEDNVTIKEM